MPGPYGLAGKVKEYGSQTGRTAGGPALYIQKSCAAAHCADPYQLCQREQGRHDPQRAAGISGRQRAVRRCSGLSVPPVGPPRGRADPYARQPRQRGCTVPVRTGNSAGRVSAPWPRRGPWRRTQPPERCLRCVRGGHCRAVSGRRHGGRAQFHPALHHRGQDCRGRLQDPSAGGRPAGPVRCAEI